MFPEPGAAQRPVCALRLDGCEVSPGAAAGSPQNLRIRIAQRGRELALLQVGDGGVPPVGHHPNPGWGHPLSQTLPHSRPVRMRRGKPG